MKKINTKRVLASCAMLALAGGALAACSSGDKKPAAESGSSTSASASEKATGPIEYWHRLPDSDGMIKVSESAKEFSKDHGVEIKVKKFEGDAADSYDKITNAVKAGNAPCLAQASYDGIPSMLARGELMDVTKEAEKYKDHYSEGTWKLTSLGGKTYGIPQDSGPMVYYYDQDAFDKLGLKAPTTWDEYWKLADDAKAKGKYASAYLTDDAGAWFAAINSANGAEWFQTEGDSWKVDVASETSKKVAEAWQKSIDSGSTLKVKRWDENDFNPKIQKGELIGYLSAAWDAPLIFDKSGKDKANWRIAQMPGEKTGPWGGSAIVVLKGCDQPAKALEFADWYNTNLKAMGSQGLVPAAKGDLEKPAWAKYYGDQDVVAALSEANKRLDPNWLFAPNWANTAKVIGDQSAKLSSGAKLVDILEQAQTETVKNLESSGIKVQK